MAAPMTAAVIGCTGLVGSHILSTLLSVDAFSVVHTISRRHPKVPEGTPKLNAIIDADTTTWAAKLSTAAPAVVFSALGTTRADAGGLAAQWKIDHDLNIELAKAAHAAGTRTFVFVSSAGSDGMTGAHLPYSQMKKGVETAVQEAGFEQAIILRPGMLMGRENARFTERLIGGVLVGVSKLLGQGFLDSTGHEGDVVAKAAVRAVLLAGEGKAPNKCWLLDGKEITRLGRDEWPAPQQAAAAATTTAAEAAGKKDEA